MFFYLFIFFHIKILKNLSVKHQENKDFKRKFVKMENVSLLSIEKNIKLEKMFFYNYKKVY